MATVAAEPRLLLRTPHQSVTFELSGGERGNRDILNDNLARLRSFHGPNGKPFDVLEIPLPEACEVSGWRLPVLPASYVNFLIVNGGVLVPTFRQGSNDDRALGMIRELFPDREITGIDCLDFVEEGGTLHCISQQQPAG